MSSEIIVTPKNIVEIANYFTDYFFENISDSYFYKAASKYQVSDINDFVDFFKNSADRYFNKKEFICSIIKENLSDFEKVNFKGFLKFRLWGFKDFLDKISDDIYLEYKSHLRYEKIISLIKVILKNSSPIVFHLHIDVNKRNFFELYDDYFNDITALCLDEFLEEFDDELFSNEDFLINSIFNLTPKIITFHNVKNIKNNKVLNTLKDIYGENLILT